MTPATRTAALLACLIASASGHPNQAAPATVLTIPSPAAGPTAEFPTPYPSYRLPNDTSNPVSVMGCGLACPRTHLAPNEELDFTLRGGRVSIQLADGQTTWLYFLSGAKPLSPAPRQVLRISKDSSPASC